MSELTQDLIQQALDQDFNKANNTFGDIMSVKLTDLLDQEKIKLEIKIRKDKEKEEYKKLSKEEKKKLNKFRVGIIRDEGSNGDREMMSAFEIAGFDVYNICINHFLEELWILKKQSTFQKKKK